MLCRELAQLSTVWYNRVYLGCSYDKVAMDRVGNPETLVTTKAIKQMSMASAVHAVQQMVSPCPLSTPYPPFTPAAHDASARKG